MLRWPSATDVSKGPETAANPFRSPPAFLEGDESRGEDQAGDEDLCLCFDFDDEAMESQTEWNQQCCSRLGSASGRENYHTGWSLLVLPEAPWRKALLALECIVTH